MNLSDQDIVQKTNRKLRRVRLIPKVDIFFDRLSEMRKPWAISGGFVRDAVLGRQAKDIDIVVDCEPEELEKTFAGLPNFRKKNTFGGWSFDIEGVQFDLWTVKQSWRFKTGKATYNGLESFLECVSLNIDAILVCPQTSIVYDGGFKDSLQRAVVDFRFLDHPYPKWIAKKAKERAERYNLGLSAQAVRFITENK